MPSAGGQWRAIRHYLSLSNLNAEVEKLLQRLKPASPDQWSDLIQRFEKAISVRLMQDGKQLELNKSSTVQCTTVNDGAKMESQVGEKAEKKEVGSTEVQWPGTGELSLQGLLLGLWRKKDLHLGKISEASWKSNKPIVNKSSIHSRTAYVVSALAAARSRASVAARADDLSRHLQQYPEARALAEREGAVRALLRVRRRLAPADDCAAAAVAEALALAGHAEPPRAPGPRILALDGGGIRGLVAIEVLRHLERLAGRPAHQLFDLVVGVSTGAIIAAALGSGAGSLDAARDMYLTLSREMFGNTSVIGGTSRLVWTHSYYDTAQWERMLRDSFGDVTLLQCNRPGRPKLALLSGVANAEARLAPFVFRSYAGLRGRGGSAARVWHAVRASAAAPTYFDEFRLDGLLHQDGGLLANNPAGVALREARALWGAAALRRAVLVSVGTGRPPAAPPRAAARTSWRDKLDKVLDAATDTEPVHALLAELLPKRAYFRLNPPLLAPVAMDEVAPARLRALQADAAAYLRRNAPKLQRAAAALTRPRPLALRAADAVKERAVLLGLRDRC